MTNFSGADDGSGRYDGVLKNGRHAAMNVARLVWIEALLWRWIAMARRWPRTVLAGVAAAAAAGLTLAALFLDVNADTTRMVSSKLDYRVAQLDYKAQFPSLQDQIVVIIRARTADGADAYAAALSTRLTEQNDVIDGVFAPFVDPFFQKNGLLFLSVERLDETLARLNKASGLFGALGPNPGLPELYDALAEAAEASGRGLFNADELDSAFVGLADTIEARLRDEPQPLSWQGLFSPADDAVHQRILTVSPKLDRSGFNAPMRAVEAVRGLAAEVANDQSRLDAEAFVTGDLALRAEELASVSRGIGLSLGLSLVFVVILLWASMRSVVLVGAAFVSLIASICITTGFAAVAFGALNLVSAAFAVLLVGLGIDFAIHFGLHLQEERAAGVGDRAATYLTVRRIGAALALCAPTSALAFMAFTPTDFVGMRQLGTISAVGVLVAFAVAMLVMPAFIKLAPGAPARSALNGVETRISQTLARRRSPLAIGVLVLGAASLFMMKDVRFDADPMAMRDPNAPTVMAFERLFDDQDTQPYTLSLLAERGPEAADLAARLSALPEVDRVVAIDDFLPKNQAEKLDAIEFTAFGLETALLSPPPVRGAELPPPLERLLLALEGLDSAEAQRFASVTQKLKTAGPALERYAEADIFAFWPDLIERLKLQIQAEFVEEETLPTGLKDRFIAQDGRIRLQIEPSQNVKDPAALAQFVDAVTTIAPGVAGGARSVLQSGRVVSHAMLQAGLLALGIVTLVLWVLVRDSVFVGVLLFCLLLAGVLTAAAGVVLGVPFNFANVIVAPLLIGVGADSGIHLGLRARRAAAPSDVFETSSPKAVFYSALTTIASFGTLALSDHRGVASMGALLAISLFFAFLCTALVQPWLLEKVDRSR